MIRLFYCIMVSKNERVKMKRVERINTMIHYINNRAFFTIKELMEEFQISKSTAIRDVNEIRLQGMPIVSEVGPEGGYFVERNRMLPSIRLTDYELRAIFLSFLATSNRGLPFLVDRKALTEKLLLVASDEQKDNLLELQNFVWIGGVNPNHPTLLNEYDRANPLLEKVIQTLLNTRHLIITLINGDERDIYVRGIFQRELSWFIEGINFKDKKQIILPIEQIKKIFQSKVFISKKQFKKIEPQKPDPNVIVLLDKLAIERFKRLNLPHIFLRSDHKNILLETFIQVKNEMEIKNATDWLLYLGEGIKFKRLPKEIAECIQKRLANFSDKLVD